MKIRKRHFRPSLRRVLTFSAAFLVVKTAKPYIDQYRGRNETQSANFLQNSKSLSENQQFVQIGKGREAFSKSETDENNNNNGSLTFEDEWNQLESEAKQLEHDLAELPKPDINTVKQQQDFEKQFGAKIPLGLPPALFMPPSQGGVQGLSLDEQQQSLARQAALALQAADDSNPFTKDGKDESKPLGKPGGGTQGDDAELYNTVDVNIREREIKIVNRTVYLKEAIPKGFWNPEAKLDSGQERMTILIFHDRDSKKDTAEKRAENCCSEMWNDLGTLQALAQTGHRVIAIDLPGYGHSIKSKTVDYVVYQFFLKLEQVLKLEKYISVVPGSATRLLIPYYFRRGQHIQALILVSPPRILEKSLQVISAASNVTLEVDHSDGNTPSGLHNFHVKTLIVHESSDREGRDVYTHWLHLLPFHEYATIDATSEENERQVDGVSEDTKISNFYMFEPSSFHKVLIDYIVRV